MPLPRPGARAPDFALLDDGGELVRLSDHVGSPLVLYFYPEDDTPGCTVQACSFRDAFPSFDQLGVPVLGVSPDTVESHQRFKKAYQLPFRLLSDPDHAVAERYGVWGERQLYGQTFVGMTRTTFLIGPDGRVASVHPNVRTEGHGERMLKAVRDLLEG